MTDQLVDSAGTPGPIKRPGNHFCEPRKPARGASSRLRSRRARSRSSTSHPPSYRSAEFAVRSSSQIQLQAQSLLSTPSWQGIDRRRHPCPSELSRIPLARAKGGLIAQPTLRSTISYSETLADKLPPGLYKVSFQLLPPADSQEAQAEFRLLTLIRCVLRWRVLPRAPRPLTDQHSILVQRLISLQSFSISHRWPCTMQRNDPPAA